MPATKGANYTGKACENFIRARLVEKKYKFVKRENFESKICLGQPIYSKQFFIGEGIYGTKIYCDFVLFHPTKQPNCLIIESKWQKSAGSVDEKYPYLIANIQEKYPYRTSILLDGHGYRSQAEQWMKSQIGNNLLNVVNKCEFQAWANNGNI